MLGVLESTRTVMDAARDVTIDQQAVERLASRLADRGVEAPEWRVWPHWWEDSDRAADYVLVLDALNFSFWGEPRWRVEYEGRLLDGYWALAACLRRALETDVPILDPGLPGLLRRDRRRRPVRGRVGDPAARRADRQPPRGRPGPARRPAARSPRSSDPPPGAAKRWSARSCAASPPSTTSPPTPLPPTTASPPTAIAATDGIDVRLYKRAQILVSDLHGIYDGQGLGAFSDLDRLTAFADYKIPQVLREAGILVYSPALAETVDRQTLIPPGDPREVEIRAATVWGCELLRQALERQRSGPPLRAFEVDWLLWSDAQGRTIDRPYHRTRTIYY